MSAKTPIVDKLLLKFALEKTTGLPRIARKSIQIMSNAPNNAKKCDQFITLLLQLFWEINHNTLPLKEAQSQLCLLLKQALYS